MNIFKSLWKWLFPPRYVEHGEPVAVYWYDHNGNPVKFVKERTMKPIDWMDIDYPWEVEFEGAGYIMTAVPTVVYYIGIDGLFLYAARLKPLGMTAYGESAEGAIDRLKEMFKETLDLYNELGRLDWYLGTDNADEMDWVGLSNV